MTLREKCKTMYELGKRLYFSKIPLLAPRRER